MISRKHEAPKRERPKPFRQVLVTDISKMTPASNYKATPKTNSIRSIKFNSKARQNN